MESPNQHHRSVAENQFGNGTTTINQGDVHYYGPHQPAHARSPARVIPYDYNPSFVRRPDLVDKLDELLPPDQNDKRAALWGLGGSGKTQIALAYAYGRFSPGPVNACSVFWVHADSEATFVQDYETIATKLSVDIRLNGEGLLKAVRIAIESHPSWVLVVDNADDLTLFGVGESMANTRTLERYLPHGHNGNLLWTSRDGRIADVVGLQHAIKVANMTVAEAEKLLAAARNNESTEETERNDMKRLLDELQLLPLAISQAGAYMRRMSTTVGEYLSMLQQERDRWEVLAASQHDPHRRRGLPHSVLQTLSISINQLQKEKSPAWQILHVIAFVDNQNIPLELLVDASGLGKGKRAKAKETVARLREFSFISLRQTESGEASYDMHKLVQEATRYSLSASETSRVRNNEDGALKEQASESEADFANAALEVVSGLFPESSPETWVVCETYLAHAIQVGNWAHVSGKKLETASLLDRLNNFLCDRSRWGEMEQLSANAWALRNEVLGERHLLTLLSMGKIGVAYEGQGLYDKAEQILVKSIDLQRGALDKRDPRAIGIKTQLGSIYIKQERYKEAEKTIAEAFDLQCEVLGERHLDTTRTMTLLGVIYTRLGRDEEAKKALDTAFALQCKVLGEKHPHTIFTMIQLGSRYFQLGRNEIAEEITGKAFALQCEVLGERHPSTISTMTQLGIIYSQLGRIQEAEKTIAKAFALQYEVLGERHPSTISTMTQLGIVYSQLGRIQEAEKTIAKAFALQYEVLGERHPSTINSMTQLGVIYAQLGRIQEAEKTIAEAFALQCEVLGESHPQTISNMFALANIRDAIGRFDEALALMQQCHLHQRVVLGEAHPDTVLSASQLQTWEHKRRSLELNHGDK